MFLKHFALLKLRNFETIKRLKLLTRSTRISGGSGRGLGGALEALDAAGVAGRVSLHKQAPLRNGIEKLFLLLLLGVVEGTTHQVPRMATFGDHRLGGGVGKSPGAGASTNTARTLQAKAVEGT